MRLYRSHHRCADLVANLFNLYVGAYARPRVTGREHLPLEGAFILASNHHSHADTAVIFNALPRAMRRRVVAAAAQDYFFDGGLRQHMSRILFNIVPVAREISRSKDPLRHVVRALREGYGVLLFPEGTRSQNGAIGPFRSGIGRLIAEFPGMPVIPTLVIGTDRVLPKGKALPRPYQVQVVFGPPLFVQAHPHHRATWQTAADQVRTALIALGAPVAATDAADPPA